MAYDHEASLKKQEAWSKISNKAKDPDITEDEIQNIIDNCPFAHHFLANNPSITAEHLDKLETKAGSLLTYSAICNNAKTKEETLLRIYHKGIGNCEHDIILHPNMTQSLILFGRRVQF